MRFTHSTPKLQLPYAGQTGQPTLLLQMANYREIYKANKGPIPEGLTVDHIDGNPNNNSPSNLRLADRYGQNQNRGEFRNNTSGYKGVTQEGIKFRARVTAFNVNYNLGLFDSPEAASAAREAKAKEVHGEFYREIN